MLHRNAPPAKKIIPYYIIAYDGGQGVYTLRFCAEEPAKETGGSRKGNHRFTVMAPLIHRRKLVRGSPLGGADEGSGCVPRIRLSSVDMDGILN